MSNKFEVYAERHNFGAGVSIRLLQQIGKTRYSAKPIVMEKFEEGGFVDPMVVLDITSAQRLMDELWQCGLRPTEGTGSAGSLAATERHLADMRRLVFKEQA